MPPISPLRSPFALRGSDATLLLVAIVWGTSYGVTKGALAFAPVLVLLALRFGLAAAILAPLAWHRSHRAQRRAAWRSGLPLGILILVILLCETYGVAQTQASHAALLISLSVVLTPIVEWVWLARRPTPAVLACVATSLIGALLLAGGWQGKPGWGDLLMVLAALLRAIAACATARMVRQTDVAMLTAVQSAVVALGCLVLASFMGDMPRLPNGPAFWAAVVYLALGCTVFAFAAQNWALQRTAPSRVGLLMGSEPAWGALFAVIWLNERLTPTAWGGGALMLGAALWTLRPDTAKRR